MEALLMGGSQIYGLWWSAGSFKKNAPCIILQNRDTAKIFLGTAT